MRLANDVHSIDVTAVTVCFTDLRTGVQHEDDFCIPAYLLNRTQIITDYARLGYQVTDIAESSVSCPINWANVYGFYSNVKGCSDERLEQTTEAEAVSA